MGGRVYYLDEGAITMLFAANTNPTVASRETPRLERHNGYDISLSRRDVNSVYDPFHRNVDPVGVGGTDVMTELVMARELGSMSTRNDPLRRINKVNGTDEFGILKGKNFLWVGKTSDSVGR